MSYGMDGRVSVPGKTKRCLYTLQYPVLFSGHPASYPTVARSLIFGGKAAGREADHSPPSSAEVKNGGAVPPIHQ
jgi:hypothetical protein